MTHYIAWGKKKIVRKKVRSCKIVDSRDYRAFVFLIYLFIARFKFRSLINLISKMFLIGPKVAVFASDSALFTGLRITCIAGIDT